MVTKKTITVNNSLFEAMSKFEPDIYKLFTKLKQQHNEKKDN